MSDSQLSPNDPEVPKSRQPKKRRSSTYSTVSLNNEQGANSSSTTIHEIVRKGDVLAVLGGNEHSHDIEFWYFVATKESDASEGCISGFWLSESSACDGEFTTYRRWRATDANDLIWRNSILVNVTNDVSYEARSGWSIPRSVAETLAKMVREEKTFAERQYNFVTSIGAMDVHANSSALGNMEQNLIFAANWRQKVARCFSCIDVTMWKSIWKFEWGYFKRTILRAREVKGAAMAIVINCGDTLYLRCFDMRCLGGFTKILLAAGTNVLTHVIVDRVLTTDDISTLTKKEFRFVSKGHGDRVDKEKVQHLFADLVQELGSKLAFACACAQTDWKSTGLICLSHKFPNAVVEECVRRCQVDLEIGESPGSLFLCQSPEELASRGVDVTDCGNWIPNVSLNGARLPVGKRMMQYEHIVTTSPKALFLTGRCEASFLMSVMFPSDNDSESSATVFVNRKRRRSRGERNQEESVAAQNTFQSLHDEISVQPANREFGWLIPDEAQDWVVNSMEDDSLGRAFGDKAFRLDLVTFGNVWILNRTDDEVTLLWNAMSLDKVALIRDTFVQTTFDFTNAEFDVCENCVCFKISDASAAASSSLAAESNVVSCPHTRLRHQVFEALSTPSCVLQDQCSVFLRHCFELVKPVRRLRSSTCMISFIVVAPLVRSTILGVRHRYGIVTVQSAVVGSRDVSLHCSNVQCRQKKLSKTRTPKDFCVHFETLWEDSEAVRNIRQNLGITDWGLDATPDHNSDSASTDGNKSGDEAHPGADMGPDIDDGEGLCGVVTLPEEGGETLWNTSVSFNRNTGRWDPNGVGRDTKIPQVMDELTRHWAERRQLGLDVTRDASGMPLWSDGCLTGPDCVADDFLDGFRCIQCGGILQPTFKFFILIRTCIGAVRRRLVDHTCQNSDCGKEYTWDPASESIHLLPSGRPGGAGYEHIYEFTEHLFGVPKSHKGIRMNMLHFWGSLTSRIQKGDDTRKPFFSPAECRAFLQSGVAAWLKSFPTEVFEPCCSLSCVGGDGTLIGVTEKRGMHLQPIWVPLQSRDPPLKWGRNDRKPSNFNDSAMTQEEIQATATATAAAGRRKNVEEACSYVMSILCAKGSPLPPPAEVLEKVSCLCPPIRDEFLRWCGVDLQSAEYPIIRELLRVAVGREAICGAITEGMVPVLQYLVDVAQGFDGLGHPVAFVQLLQTVRPVLSCAGIGPLIVKLCLAHRRRAFQNSTIALLRFLTSCAEKVWMTLKKCRDDSAADHADRIDLCQESVGCGREPQHGFQYDDPSQTGFDYNIIRKASGGCERNVWPMPKEGGGLKFEEISASDCTKKRMLTISDSARCGLWIWTCMLHHRVVGHHVIKRGEGKRDAILSLYRFMREAPKFMFVDFACHAEECAYNWVPAFYLNTRFYHDTFHGYGHKCSQRYSCEGVRGTPSVNTSVMEAFNAYLQNICGILSSGQTRIETEMFWMHAFVTTWNYRKFQQQQSRSKAVDDMSRTARR